MRGKVRDLVIFLLETIAIVAIVLVSVLPVSCKLTETGIHILDGDYDFPKLTSFVVEDESNLSLNFSEKVKLVSQVVSNEEDLVIDADYFYDESNQIVNVELKEKMEVGRYYEMVGTVKDEFGNSLTFAVPFRGYNSRVPKLLITEIQSESVSSRTTKEKNSDTYRNEYVEFVALTAGNLWGLELCSAYDGEDRKFVFPDVEVSKGEVFVVHLRNRGNGCISENGDDLKLAYSSYTDSTVRDLWTDDTSTALGNKTDVLLLRNSSNGKIMDCFAYKDSKVSEWPKSMINYLELISESGFTDSDIYGFEYESDNKTSSTTITRKNVKTILDRFSKDEESEYPVKLDKSEWSIEKASPGTL